jgi:succinate-semialdehyde dehydrogenase/glutarate-semialdehyde dehydrogenase
MTAASSTKAKARELKTINPATEEVINTYEIMTKEQISEKAKKAQNALSDWKIDIQKRVDHIHDFAQELRKNKEVLARTVTKEMGKVIKEARSELEKCECLVAECCYYY